MIQPLPIKTWEQSPAPGPSDADPSARLADIPLALPLFPPLEVRLLLAPVRAPRRRILLVDDHACMRKAVGILIARTLPNALIFECDDGAHAIATFNLSGADLLVTDHWMPGMVGTALILHLRERRVTIPMILLSSDPEVEALAMAAGASHYIGKHEIADQLPKVIRQYLEGTSRPALPPPINVI